jgi:beta-barrel assembly-enhancing protease
MKKLLFQALAIIVLFFLTWSAINTVDWMTIFKVKQRTETIEEKLGELFWDLFKSSQNEIKDKEILDVIDSILTKICTVNDIDKSQLKLHVLDNSEVNAFALPDKHLVIYTGLITSLDNAFELSGVISHELAHIESNHVMKKLIKEVGLSVLISMTTGNSGSDIIQMSSKILSSTAYDRSLEREADILAADYLMKANVDPEHLANFLFRISIENHTFPQQLTWISTHPDAKERAMYIIEYAQGKTFETDSILSNNTWVGLLSNLKKD